MVRYNEVSITTWISGDFRTLTPNGKLLWLYLLTGPIRMPIPGIYRAGVGSCTDDLGWSSDVFKKSFKELEQRDMARANWNVNVIYLPKWLKYNRPPSNPNVMKSWLGMLDAVPNCELKTDYIQTLSDMSMETNSQYSDLLEDWMKGRMNTLESYHSDGNGKIDPQIKQVVKKDDKYAEFEVIAREYTNGVKVVFPKLSYFKNGILDKFVTNGAKEIEKLHRLDGVSLSAIKEVLAWIVESYDETKDFNWLSNLQSLKSVRRRSNNGNTKWENIIMSYSQEINKGKKKKRKIDYSDVTNSPI